MKKILLSKILAIGIIVLFIGVSVSSAYANFVIKSLIGDNQPPTSPSINGPTEGKVGISYNYHFSSIDPEGNDIYYYIVWGDGNILEWIGPFPSGEVVTISHTWEMQGTYIIRAKAKDLYGAESDWSELEVNIIGSSILYVGGTGEGNYTKIQDAIDNASKDSTVFVFDDSSPYYENVKINKSINLIGENRDTTIIDGGNNRDVVNVDANRVDITGFTIQNSGDKFYPYFDAGIKINSNYNIITGNDIIDNKFGICFNHSSSSTIMGNTISNNYCGIYLWEYSESNTITGNIIFDNERGIWLWDSSNNIITGNDINLNNEHGILLTDSNFNTITENVIANNEYGIAVSTDSNNNIISRNTISNNYWGIMSVKVKNTITDNIISNNRGDGIYINGGSDNIITGNTISNNQHGITLIHSSSNNNIIYHNNFIKNMWNTHDEGDDTWDDGKYGNYYSDYKEKYPFAIRSLSKPWMWNTPYEISGGDNKDKCPLVNQWPKSKPRTIRSNTPFPGSLLLRFFKMFPILQRMLYIIK